MAKLNIPNKNWNSKKRKKVLENRKFDLKK